MCGLWHITHLSIFVPHNHKALSSSYLERDMHGTELREERSLTVVHFNE